MSYNSLVFAYQNFPILISDWVHEKILYTSLSLIGSKEMIWTTSFVLFHYKKIPSV